MGYQEVQYTVVVNGRPEGPYHFDELTTLVITADTFVRKTGMDDYKEAHEFEELRELFGFSYQHTAPQYFAAFDQRLLACVIDYFFITLVYAVVILLGFIVVTEKTHRIALAIVGLPFIFIVKLIYGTITDASAKQGGIGKRLMKIRVTDMDGLRIGYGKSLGRNLSKLLSLLPFLIGYLYSFLNRKQQCFHDIIAGTLVVKDRLI
jgi:uncharacterized RDD family membrane protein YckC